LPGDPFDALGDSNRRAIVELLRKATARCASWPTRSLEHVWGEAAGRFRMLADN
jgi:hypothetical protein